MNNLDALFKRLDQLLARIEAVIPASQQTTCLEKHIAFRWHKRGNERFIQPINHPHSITLDALLNIEEQKQRLDRNTRQFISGFPANNSLLTGARGTGKSSLIKALLNQYADQGLRLIEVNKEGLIDLYSSLVGFWHFICI